MTKSTIKAVKFILYQKKLKDFHPKKITFALIWLNGKNYKSAPFKVHSIACYTIFPSFGRFVNTTPVKISPFCCEPFVESFFHIFVRIEAPLSKYVNHRCKQVVIGRSQVWSKLPGMELPSWVVPTCREPYLPYVIKHCHEGKWLCVASFDILAFFQAGNCSNRSIVVGNV